MNPASGMSKIIEEILARREAGELLSDEEVLAAYPELAPALQKELIKLERIRQARLQAEGSAGVQAPHNPRLGKEVTDKGTSMALPPQIPDYELLRWIDSGGFGEVWLAENKHGNRYVAIKLIPKKYPIDLEGVQNYKKSVDNHPNLLAILHIGETSDWFYYTMPLAEDFKGATAVRPADHYEPLTLGRYVKANSRLSIEQLCRIACDILAGLAHLHALGLIHKDVKPQNILRINGAWQLADMGLIARSEEVQRLCGTAKFWPPEGPRDATADLYALGKVLFLLFAGPDLDHFQHFLEGKWNVRQVDPQSARLRAVIMQACAENPQRRFQSAAEMRQAIELSVPAGFGHRSWIKWWALAATLVTVSFAGLAYQLHKTPSVLRQSGPTAVPLQVISMEIEARRRRRAPDDWESLGKLGRECVALRLQDQVTVHAQLGEPAYCYLLTLSPDGTQHRLLSNGEPDDPPTPAQELTKGWLLDEGTGMQVFLLLVSREQLPSYRAWSAQYPEIAWRGPAGFQGVWRYDDGNFERLDKSRSPVDEPKADGHLESFIKLCNLLRNRPGVATVRAIAFPVEPENP